LPFVRTVVRPAAEWNLSKNAESFTSSWLRIIEEYRSVQRWMPSRAHTMRRGSWSTGRGNSKKKGSKTRLGLIHQ